MDEDNAWVFDSLICFLNGPVWNAPLQSFIEEKSLIFEPNVSDNEEYGKIYEEFKNLVDFMLGSFMEDIGITPSQFEDACNRGNQDGIPIHFEQNLFELIWAANDYEMFKRMMTHRNVELQLQALELIEQKYGITPQSFIPQKRQQKSNSQMVETTVEISPRPSIKAPKLEEEIMEEILQQFPKEEQSPDVKSLLEEKHVLEETLKHIEENISVPLEIEKEVKPTENGKDIAKVTPIKRKELPVVKTVKPEPSKEVDAQDIKKRQEYLKAQRDKLVALKKEARKKHLDIDNSDTKRTKQQRPKSAKAAEDLLAGSSTANLEPQKLQFRRALVERLKSEVISNKDKSQ